MPVSIANLKARRRATILVDLVMDDGSIETITIKYEPDRFTWGLSQQLSEDSTNAVENAVDLLSQLIVEWDIEEAPTLENVRALGVPIQVALARAIESDIERFQLGGQGKASNGGSNGGSSSATPATA